MAQWSRVMSLRWVMSRMSHVTNESKIRSAWPSKRHDWVMSREWVMSQMSHVTNESQIRSAWRYDWVMSREWVTLIWIMSQMSHVTDESCHKGVINKSITNTQSCLWHDSFTYESVHKWVTSQMSHVTNPSQIRSLVCDMTHSHMSHFTNESHHKWVMPQMSHEHVVSFVTWNASHISLIDYSCHTHPQSRIRVTHIN